MKDNELRLTSVEAENFTTELYTAREFRSEDCLEMPREEQVASEGEGIQRLFPESSQAVFETLSFPEAML